MLVENGVLVMFLEDFSVPKQKQVGGLWMKLTLAILCTMVFLVWAGVRGINQIVFDRNCGGYLKRAADANTTELAAKNLETAMKYIKENGLTSGYTSILYRTPDEDVSFWHDNLNASLEELRIIKSDATQLEKSNILIKLRETLLDHKQDGVSVTKPSGISIFPSNAVYMTWALLSFSIGIWCWITLLLDV